MFVGLGVLVGGVVWVGSVGSCGVVEDRVSVGECSPWCHCAVLCGWVVCVRQILFEAGGKVNGMVVYWFGCGWG